MPDLLFSPIFLSQIITSSFFLIQSYSILSTDIVILLFQNKIKQTEYTFFKIITIRCLTCSLNDSPERKIFWLPQLLSWKVWNYRAKEAYTTETRDAECTVHLISAQWLFYVRQNQKLLDTLNSACTGT